MKYFALILIMLSGTIFTMQDSQKKVRKRKKKVYRRSYQTVINNPLALREREENDAIRLARACIHLLEASLHGDWNRFKTVDTENSYYKSIFDNVGTRKRVVMEKARGLVAQYIVDNGWVPGIIEDIK